MSTEPAARITRVVLKNFKSIVECDVELRPLTILVGPNGSGKSNFLDALRFISDALKFGPDPVDHGRGRSLAIISRGVPDGAAFLIEVHFVLPSDVRGSYTVEIRVPFPGEWQLRTETCVLDGPGSPAGGTRFTVRDGHTLTEWKGFPIAPDIAPARITDRLYLASLSGLPLLRPAYDLLTRAAFYNPSLVRMRDLFEPSKGNVLAADGANVASVLRRMERFDPETRERVIQYLRHIAPNLHDVIVESLGTAEILRFVDHRAKGDEYSDWQFSPLEVSDGTLRALGVLVALFQGRMGGESAVSLVGIEEPEAGLHPHAAGVLLNALLDASVTTQVIVTTHSDALLDSDDVDIESLLAVVAQDGITMIGPVDEIGRSVLRDDLFTAGELLQLDQLRPGTTVNGSASAPSPEPVPERP